MITLPFQKWPKIDNFKLENTSLHLWLIEIPQSDRAHRFEELHLLQSKRRQLLKHILSKYLKYPVKNTDLDINSSGKPFLKSNPLQFNVSHSHNLILIAIHPCSPLGVDIEWMTHRNFLDFGRRFWGDAWTERHLKPLPPFCQRMGFFQAWTQTEAWVKAHGETIFNFSDIEVQKLMGREARMEQNWQFLSFTPKVNCIGSICCSQDVTDIAKMTLDLQDTQDFEHFRSKGAL